MVSILAVSYAPPKFNSSPSKHHFSEVKLLLNLVGCNPVMHEPCSSESSFLYLANLANLADLIINLSAHWPFLPISSDQNLANSILY